MSNIDEIKIDIMNRMYEEIDGMLNQVQLVKDFEIKPVSMKEWQAYCRTPLRHNKIMLDLAKAIFPEGDEFKLCPNGVMLCIDNIKLEIPTCLSTAITVKLDWLSSTPEPALRYTSPSIKRYFELLDDSNSTWYDLAKHRYPYEDSKIKLFIWWNIIGKWKKTNRQEWEDKFKEDEARYERNMEKYNYRQDIIKKNKETLIRIMPRLTEFSKVKAYYRYNWLNSDGILELMKDGE